MAITTYSELQTAVDNWLDRSDIDDERVKEGIALAEAEMSADLHELRELETTATLAVTSEYTALPSDYGIWRAVTAETSPKRKLDYRTSAQIDHLYPTGPSSDPRVFSIVGANFQIMPIWSGNVTLNYVANIPALSDSNTTNSVLTRYPNLYLYGALYQISVLIFDDERAVGFKNVYDQYVMKAEKRARRERYGMGALQARNARICDTRQ